jgi:hypothetical protein
MQGELTDNECHSSQGSTLRRSSHVSAVCVYPDAIIITAGKKVNQRSFQNLPLYQFVFKLQIAYTFKFI